MTKDYLEHYGKKGMKWGVRRARGANKRRKASAARARKAEGQVAKNVKAAGGKVKKAAKEQVKRQLGQTDRQKRNRAEANVAIKKAAKTTQTKISALNSPANKKAVKRGTGFVSGILVTAGRSALTSYLTTEFMGQLVKRRAPTGT